MTLIGLFSGAKAPAAPAGSASAPVGDAGFAALLGAVSVPLLFAGAAASTSPTTALPPETPLPISAAPVAAPAPATPSKIQENGAAPVPTTPGIPGKPEAADDQTPEFPTGEMPVALTEPRGTAAAPAPTKGKKATDAAPDALPQVAAAPPAPSAPATVVISSAAAAPPAHSGASDPSIPVAAAPALAAIALAPAMTATQATAAPMADPTPVPVTVMVSGVSVELVATAKVTPKQPDATSDTIAPIAAPVAPTATASAAPVAPTPAANAPAFAEQLAKPLFTLATGPTGDHIVTVKVTPDNLGPVTVRAHVGSEGMRVELFAPNDAGREAIRSILPDLRRDLAGQGVTANLDLSSQSQPFDRGDGTPARERSGIQDLPGRPDTTSRDGDQPSRRNHTATSMLDVLA